MDSKAGREAWRNPTPAQIAQDPECRPYSCGTRSVRKRAPSDFRVVCATCGEGGSLPFRTRAEALHHAVGTSYIPCPGCGAR